MKEQGWFWTEEYIWHKKNCYPGKWPNRFRDAWERCLHFTKGRKFKMFQKAVMVPMGEWANKRLARLSETDKIRDESHVGSGFGKNVSHWVDRDYAYPTNVLHMATECANREHSATFPVQLPSWFIKFSAYLILFGILYADQSKVRQTAEVLHISTSSHIPPPSSPTPSASNPAILHSEAPCRGHQSPLREEDSFPGFFSSLS